MHATTPFHSWVTLFISQPDGKRKKPLERKKWPLGIKASNLEQTVWSFPIMYRHLPCRSVWVLIPQHACLRDYYHRQALHRQSKIGTLTIKTCKSRIINPYVDLHRWMAQTNFALARTDTKRPYKKLIQKVHFTDQDKKPSRPCCHNQLMRACKCRLSPRSSRNWKCRSIYRNIAGVAQNALVYSLDSYGGQSREIHWPALRVTLEDLYSIKNYDLAIRFSRCSNLKPDYQTHTSTWLSHWEKGDLQNAKAVADQTVKCDTIKRVWLQSRSETAGWLTTKANAAKNQQKHQVTQTNSALIRKSAELRKHTEHHQWHLFQVSNQILRYLSRWVRHQAKVTAGQNGPKSQPVQNRPFAIPFINDHYCSW